MNRRNAYVIAGLLAAAVISAFAALMLVLAFRAVGRAVYAGDGVKWAPLAALLTGSFALTSGASWLAARAGTKIATQLRTSTLRRALNVDPDIALRVGPGQAQAVALDAELVGTLVVTAAPGAAVGLAQSAVGVAVLLRGGLLRYEAWVGLAAVLTIGLTGRFLARSRGTWSLQRAEITGILSQRLLGLRTVSVQESAPLAEAQGASLLSAYQRAARRMDTWTAALTASAFVFSAIFVLVAATRSSPGPTRSADIGAALLVGAGLTKLCVGIAELINASTTHRRERLLDGWRLEPVPPLSSETDALISASRLSYSYGAGVGVATPMDFALWPGDRLLITGGSGSGKTTLGELLTGRRKPTTGVITVHSGTKVARVPQLGDDYIFHASLLFNLLCGSEWPPTEEATRRAHQLCIDLDLGSLVERMPNGLAQPIGEGGWRLSSGEAARVGLARTLLSQPDVVILDETTAALDPITRRIALDVVERQTTAQIVIAHP